MNYKSVRYAIHLNVRYVEYLSEALKRVVWRQVGRCKKAVCDCSPRLMRSSKVIAATATDHMDAGEVAALRQNLEECESALSEGRPIAQLLLDFDLQPGRRPHPRPADRTGHPHRR